MPNFFKKLSFVRNLSVENGDIRLYGQRTQLVPVEMLAGIVRYAKSDDVAEALYKAFEQETYNFFKRMAAGKRMTNEQVVEAGMDMVEGVGWGKALKMEIDIEKGKALLQVENTSVAVVYLKKFGKSKEPVCHLLRGSCAGAVKMASGRDDIAAIETKWIAMGDPYCEFRIGPIDELTKE